ncbi:hypothetical protein N7476_000432 [Penicillium atrosanguineum]|uniref:Uncharacterized protein n=1 Tax=Penicillium atrosanguineum TaxID=1132637 RepID=A0A9W9UCQ2_9EURO|nr:hypothetical protein N7476_000432 [Penicillium atrosanguineum]
MFGPFPPFQTEHLSPKLPKGSPGKSPKESSEYTTVRHSLDSVTVPTTEAPPPFPPPAPPAFVLPVSVSESVPPSVTAGNAFSVVARRKWEEDRQTSKGFGDSLPSSPTEAIFHPCLCRKTSYLDYDGDLALPMPKPRHDSVEAPSGDESARPTFKNHSVTDPIFTHNPFQCDLYTPEDMKKRSKVDLIKSKLSFKDLRKEGSLEDINISPSVLQLPEPFNESSKRAFHRATSPNTIPSMAQSNYNFKAKLKPIDHGKVSGCSSQSSTAPSKIPLPPSGTYTNAHGIVPSRTRSRHVSVAESQSSSTTQDKTKSDSSAEYNTGATPTGKCRPKNLTISRTSTDIAQRPSVSRGVPIYPSNKDPHPMRGDLLKPLGKGKYMPRPWAERDCGPSVSAKENVPALTAYKENESPVTSMPDYLPSFRERIEKADLSLEGFVSLSRSIPMQVDDLVDMVRSIQRQTDLGINNLNNKLDELANWISDQLQKQVNSISDLARTKADLNSKQLEVSKEIMKFQMECRLEVGVMERRLNTFEMKVMDEAQAEIRSLGRSYEDLNHKTETLINKFSSDTLQKFINCQRRRTEEIQRDVAYLKAQDEKYKLDETQKEQTDRRVTAQMDAAKLTPSSYPATPMKIELLDEHTAVQAKLEAPKGHMEAPSNTSMDVQRYSESTIRSTQPLINEHDHALPMPPTPASAHAPFPLRPRISSAQDHKSAGTLPRSMSLAKKGFMTGTKGTVSNASDRKEKQLESTPSNEGKKRSIFSFLHRRDHHENGTGKYQPSLRRTEATLLLDDGSSRTSTPTPPIPAIPRNITKFAQMENKSLTVVHPALRAATVQNVVHEDEVLSSSHSGIPLLSPGPSFSYNEEVGLKCSTRGSFPSTCTTASSFSESKVQSASDSFHSAMQHTSLQENTAKLLKQAVYSPANDNLHIPLLDDTEHGWVQDQVSLHEQRYTDTMH